jgi:hypothetical protein
MYTFFYECTLAIRDHGVQAWGTSLLAEREGEIFGNAMNQADQSIVSHPYDIKVFWKEDDVGRVEHVNTLRI